jgi:methylmalonyl-CoA/ethylmalonyl-CoA epimerase
MNLPEATESAHFVDHVGILVADADQAAARFAERFGLTVVHDEVVTAVGVRLVYLAGTDAAVPTTIQLVEPVRPGPIKTHFDRNGEGVHHVCLAVSDVDATLSALGEDGKTEVFSGGRGRRSCFLSGQTCGTLIELAEMDSPRLGGFQ